MISAAALCVSVVAAFVSALNYSQSGLYSEIAIRPEVVTGGRIFEEEVGYLYLANVGQGTAYINDVEIRYKAEKISSRSFDLRAKRYFDELNLFKGLSSFCSIYMEKFLIGSWVAQNQSRPFLHSSGRCPAKIYMPFLKDVRIKFTYSSGSGNIYFMEFGSANSEKEIEKIFGEY